MCGDCRGEYRELGKGEYGWGVGGGCQVCARTTGGSSMRYVGVFRRCSIFEEEVRTVKGCIFLLSLSFSFFQFHDCLFSSMRSLRLSRDLQADCQDLPLLSSFSYLENSPVEQDVLGFLDFMSSRRSSVMFTWTQDRHSGHFLAPHDERRHRFRT